MKMPSVIILIAFVMLGNSFGPIQAQSKAAQIPLDEKETTFDGTWWLSSDPDQRSGFLDGIADCLTWVARKEGFSETPNQLDDKIINYYTSHPNDKKLSVVDVWQKIKPQLRSKQSKEGGETWDNPHWYLNGLWWNQCTDSHNQGYLEGYLWCMRTQVNPQKEFYSRSIKYYVAKIDNYIKNHPKADDESVATILARFQDKSQR